MSGISNNLLPVKSDFTVIGASFAGSLLAYRLSKHGSVSLFDRIQPGTRLKCAGGIKAEEFAKLDLDIPHVKTENVIVSSGGIISGFKSAYAVADRRDLDAAVFKKAIASGAVFQKAEYISHDPAKKLVKLKSGEEIADLEYGKLILAKGYHQDTAGGFHGTSYVEIVEGLSRYDNSLYFRILDNCIGYFWIFPLPGGRLNIGIGSFSETPFSPSEFRKFKEEEGLDGNIVCKGGGRIPMRPVTSVKNGDVYLFGDSAGMVLAINGEGLRYISRMSGIWAECIAGEKNLNLRWVLSRTYARLRFGSAIMQAVIFAERHFGKGVYAFLCKIGAKVRNRIRR